MTTIPTDRAPVSPVPVAQPLLPLSPAPGGNQGRRGITGRGAAARWAGQQQAPRRPSPASGYPPAGAGEGTPSDTGRPAGRGREDLPAHMFLLGRRTRHRMAVAEIYIKLIVGFPRDPKVRALARFGDDAGLARDLYVQMVLYCKENLTDGWVPAEEVGALAYPLGIDHANQLAKQLASVGLTKELSKDEAPGWQVLAFLKRNRSKEQVQALSEVRAEAGRAGGVKSPGTGGTAGQKATQAKGKQVAKQRGTKAGPIDRDRDKDRDASSEASPGAAQAPARQRRAAGNASDVIAAYVEGATAAGQPRPAEALRARVGKQANQLLAEGYSLADLVESARRMGAGEWNDLAVQVRKDAAANGQPKPGTPRQINYTDEEYASGWGRPQQSA